MNLVQKHIIRPLGFPLKLSMAASSEAQMVEDLGITVPLWNDVPARIDQSWRLEIRCQDVWPLAEAQSSPAAVVFWDMGDMTWTS